MAKIKTLLYEFRLSDVEDPELYAAGPLWDWQQTDYGKWVMDHADDPTYHVHPDPMTYGYRIAVTGLLEEQDYTFFMLKWGKR